MPTFSVDSGFWYSIPDHLRADVTIGARVRVSLGGRKVRGFVVAIGGPRDKLKEILGVSGSVPVFDERVLKSLRWAAQHYVAPLSVLLEKSAPPTLPRAKTTVSPTGNYPAASQGPLIDWASDVAGGERRPALSLVVNWSDPGWVEALAPTLANSRSVMVVVPTMREVDVVGSLVTARYPKNTVVVPDASGAAVTRVWEKAQSDGVALVGPPRVASWKVGALGMGVVIEESRRAMKDRQTPTIHVRDMLRTRSRIEGFGLMFVGPTPSVEVIAEGAEIVQPRRPWGLVEVVDRRDDAPGSGFVSERALAALRSIAGGGGRAFVFTHIRAGQASARCTACRALRRCLRCGSHLGQAEVCRRCGQSGGPCAHCGGRAFESMGSIPSRIVGALETRLGAGAVGPVGSGNKIEVGTERDLANIEEVHLALAIDCDALIYGQNYRSGEEALRVLARLVNAVARGKGYRTILQTSNPDSSLIAALRRGEPIPYLEGVLAARARDGFPPATEMLAMETRAVDPGIVSEALKELAPGMVMGPMQSGEGDRWLLQGDLGRPKGELRKLVQRLRDSGGTVRVDADPIDL